jgi:hypothetical protein
MRFYDVIRTADGALLKRCAWAHEAKEHCLALRSVGIGCYVVPFVGK